MTTYFITRHLDSLTWAKDNHIHFDKHLTHLDTLDELKSGDTVIGTLPINMVYQINQLGVRYLHLSLNIPKDLRGMELNTEQLKACNITLEEYHVYKP